MSSLIAGARLKQMIPTLTLTIASILMNGTIGPATIYTFILAMLAAGVAVLVAIFQEMVRKRIERPRSRNWPTAAAKIDLVSVADVTDNAGVSSYRPTLAYIYHNPEEQMGDYSRDFGSKDEAPAWANSYKGETVSAHTAEFHDSEPLRSDVAAVLATEGVRPDAIFGWFFGHEHRCELYQDSATQFNARLIGNGCSPHQVQTEDEADPGCTPFVKVNRRQTDPNSGAATSMFVMLNFSDSNSELIIEYIDKDY
jgi:hypothetical protein